jgi:hypothetical protein
MKIPLLRVFGSLFDDIKSPPLRILHATHNPWRRSILTIQEAPITVLHKFVIN